MKTNPTNWPIPDTVKLTLRRTLWSALVASTIGLGTAYARVETCPDPASLIPNDDKLVLDSVKLKIDYKIGDVVDCIYRYGDDGEKIGLSIMGGSPDERSEIVPVNDQEWNNDAVKNEFICQPSETTKCAFDILNPSADGSQQTKAKAKQTVAAASHPVKLHFAPGTAFVAYACDKPESGKATCTGPLYVDGTYQLSPDTKRFCVEVFRFPLSWAQYYFEVSDDYNGVPMEWWGASMDPKFTLPYGIVFQEPFHTSTTYTQCDRL